MFLLVGDRAAEHDLATLAEIAGILSERTLRERLIQGPDARVLYALVAGWRPRAADPTAAVLDAFLTRAVLQSAHRAAPAPANGSFDMAIPNTPRSAATGAARSRRSLVTWYSPRRALWLGRELTITPRKPA